MIIYQGASEASLSSSGQHTLDLTGGLELNFIITEFINLAGEGISHGFQFNTARWSNEKSILIIHWS